MKADYRNHMLEGTRTELLGVLGKLRDGARHNEDARLHEEAGQGIRDLMMGASSVRVGVMAYDVTDDT